jgi:hypothetical protein
MFDRAQACPASVARMHARRTSISSGSFDRRISVTASHNAGASGSFGSSWMRPPAAARASPKISRRGPRPADLPSYHTTDTRSSACADSTDFGARLSW